MAGSMDLVTLFKNLALVPRTTLAEASPEDADKLVKNTIEQVAPYFSKDCPLVQYKADAWNGTAVALDGWVAGESEIANVESPTGQHPPLYLDTDDYDVNRNGEIYLASVATGASYLVTYSTPHTVSSSVLTVPANKREAYCLLVAARLCLVVAAFQTESLRPDINADSVNYQGKTDQYRRLAQEFMSQYRKALGLAEKDTPLAFEVEVEYDTPDDRIFGTEAVWPVL